MVTPKIINSLTA